MASLRQLLLVALVFGALFSPVAANAVEPPKPQNTKNGITISPFLQQINILPDDGTKSFTLKLTNNTSNLQELILTSRDFGSLNDTGGVLLEGNPNYTQKYGLTSWMTLGTNTIVLQPKESKEVPVAITNRASLQPGGHYAAVVVSVKALDTVTGNAVAINQQLMSLILVNKAGGERYALKLAGIQENGNWLRLPNTVKLRFQNPGNVHVIPRGTVLLKDPTGKILAKGIINAESAYVLPETFRELYVPLAKVSNDLPFPGAYRVEVNYRYDGINKTAQKSSIVKFINLKLFIFLIVFALIIWKAVSNYKSYPKKSK